MNRAIVTGGNGFVGSHLVCALAEKGVKVYAIIKDEYENIEFIKNHQNVQIIYCDLFHLEQLKEKILFDKGDQSIDLFYHLAWAGTSGNARADYTLQLKNAEATCHAVKVAKDLNVRKFIFAGSIMEYECEQYIPQDESKPGLGNIYSVGKVAAHYMAKTLAYHLELDFETMIISNIYGPGEISARLINKTLLKLLNREETAFTEGDQLYDFIYITDAIKAMLLIGEKGQAYHNYYIGNQKQYPLKQFIRQIGACVDPHCILGFGKIPFNGAVLTYKEFDTQALYRDLDFKTEVSFTDGINKTIKWLQSEERNY